METSLLRIEHEHRPRRYLGKATLLLLRPVIRYSYPRDAYVLRVVGRHFGPVMRPERRRTRRHAENVNRGDASVA
jgi:hypothetical protein